VESDPELCEAEVACELDVHVVNTTLLDLPELPDGSNASVAINITRIVNGTVVSGNLTEPHMLDVLICPPAGPSALAALYRLLEVGDWNYPGWIKNEDECAARGGYVAPWFNETNLCTSFTVCHTSVVGAGAGSSKKKAKKAKNVKKSPGSVKKKASKGTPSATPAPDHGASSTPKFVGAAGGFLVAGVGAAVLAARYKSRVAQAANQPVRTADKLVTSV